MRALNIFIRYVLPLAALAAGFIITLLLLKSGPQARPMPSRSSSIMVETTTVAFGNYPAQIQAMGVVTPSRSVEVRPQVSGQVIEISEKLVPGGRFTKGEILLQLDPTDYRLLRDQQKDAVTQAENDLAIEQGKQLVVQREYELLGESVSEAEKQLMLRKPQLSSLQTALSTSQAKLDQAELNLARTTIRAPYDGIIGELNVNIGSWVSTSSALATIIGDQTYWIEASVAEKQLQWITIPTAEDKRTSTVRIYNPSAWGETTFRDGSVIKLLPGLESQGRMARLLVAVSDPLSQMETNVGKPPLLLDSYVRLEITGKTIPNSVQLPREYLRDGNKVWLFGDDSTLAFREISIGFKNRDNVLVTSGISKEDRVITSDIATPVEGLVLIGPVTKPPGDSRGNRSDRPKSLAAASSPERGGEHE